MNVLSLVIPDFLLIALGWLLFHKLNFSRAFFQGAEQLVYFVLFPALLFHSITQAPLSFETAALLIQAVVAVLVFGVLMAMLALPVLKPDPLAHASTAQCAFRFNTYIGLSLAAGVGGSAGQTIMAVLVGIAVPLTNTGAVFFLARKTGGRVFDQIVKNPFILATVAGLLVNMLGIPVPGPLNTALGKLASCAIALGLICVGATLSLQGARGSVSLSIWMIVVRLALTPLVALLIGWLLNLPTLDRQMLLLFSALPTASSAHVLAARMGGDGRLVAFIMTSGTLLSAITIPFWITLGP